MLPFLIILVGCAALVPLQWQRLRPPGPRTRPRPALGATAVVLAGAVTVGSLSATFRPADAEDAPGDADAATLAGDRMVTAPMAGYQLADAFGEVPGVTQVDPVGIADDGTIVGNYVHEGRPKAFRARPGQPFEELYAAGAERITADAVAPDGTIAGHIATLSAPDADGWVGVWDPDDEGNLGDFTRRLAQPKGAPTVETVRAVNSRGDVLLGTSVLHPDGNRTLLAHPQPGGSNPQLSALDMNETGQVVGFATWTEFNQPVTRAVQWNAGVPVLQLQFGQVSAIADVIADDGTIGMRAATGTPEQGYRTWVVAPGVGPATPVAPLGQEVLLRDINERRTAVGMVMADGALRPVAFDGTLKRLDRLVDEPTVHLQSAIGINTDGVIAGDVDWQGAASVFLARPVNPVVFVHGAGASRISQTAPRTADRGDEGDQEWIRCGADRMHLSLWPEDVQAGRALTNLAAFAPLRDETCYGIGSWADDALGVYDTLLSHIEGTGFRPYRVDARLDRYTTAGCDTSQNSPNLFTFAYDWRLDNGDSGRRLADFMGCVRRFWPDRDVNIVTHSMGSLVAQRYLLDAGDDAPVDRLITFGAPWLGSPKLVNVLYTGDFAAGPVNGPAGIIRHIVGSFPAAHQLMAGPYYHQLATRPVFRELGADRDLDGVDRDDFTFAHLKQMLDAENPTFTPGTVAESFQTQAGQADWSSLDTDVDITHFVGLQAGRNTIGTVVYRTRPVCDLSSFSCEPRTVVEQSLVCGDGTVPLVSAARVGRGRDLNAPDAEIQVLTSPSADENGRAEHTGMTTNPAALGRLDQLLATPSAKDGPGTYSAPLGAEDQDTASCGGSANGAGLAAAGQGAPDRAHSLRYLELLGGSDVTVTDDLRHVTPMADGSTGTVPGVTQFRSNAEDAGLTTLPLSSTRTYRIAFHATGDPLQLELLDGTQDNPTRAMRWTDVQVPEGAAELEMAPERTPVLRIDSDGDGEVDSPVAPTVDLSGPAAADVTAPELTVTAVGTGEDRRYAVSATDDGPGAIDVLVSTGGRFAPYDGPFSAPAGTTTIRAFATDAAGNRSPMTDVAIGSVPTTPLTTGTRTREANPRGWNTGPVDVALRAEAAGGVASVTWWAEGATATAPSTVAGDRADVAVTATGVTHLRFRATGADGTVEPVRTLTVRIDDDDPSVQLQTPYADSTVADLDRIAGTAADATSAPAEVDVEILDPDDRVWDGDSWEDVGDGEHRWLNATVTTGPAGTATFERRSANPSGADLPPGGYRIGLRVTDGAGHRSVTEPARVTVAADAAWQAVELAPLGPSQTSSARAVDDRGAVLGTTTDGGTTDVVWAGGTVTALPVAEDAEVTARSIDGSMAGSVSSGGGGSRAFEWSPTGTPTELALTPGTTSSWAVDRNDAGTVIGMTGNAGVFVDAVRWDDDGAHRLALPFTGVPATTDINSGGAIVGWIDPPDIGDVTPRRAVRWDPDGTAHPLGTLGAPSRAPSTATAVNDLGVVVGSAWTDVEIAGDQHAVVFRDGRAVPVDAGLFADGATATDVNDRGWIVGDYTTRTGSLPRAFLSTDAESAVDLNTLLPDGSGWVLERATGINDLGQIVGRGRLDGVPRGFVLSTLHAPVAEDVSVTAAGETRITLDGWDPDPTDTLTHHLVGTASHGSAELLDGGVVRYRPQRGFTGTDRFDYRVEDGRFRSDSATVTVTVTEDPTGPDNREPLATITLPATGIEGTSVTADGSASSDPDGDELTFAWDLDGDGAFDDGTAPTATTTLLDDGPHSVALRVTDPDGATASATATLTVLNSAPTIGGLRGTASVTAGTPLELSGTVDDVPADTHTAVLDPGDGSAPAPVAVTDGRFTLRHTYTTAGVHDAVLSVVDDDGAHAEARITVTVEAPERVLAPATISVAGSVAVPGSGTRPDRIGLVGAVIAPKGSTGSTWGAIGIARTGSTPMALGSVRVTRAGTYTEGGVRYGVVIGTGVLGSGRTARSVTYELTVADGRPDRVWLKVTDSSGAAVTGLTVGGTPPGGGLTFLSGSASVTPR